MFPTLVQDNRRKGRSAGSLVESSILLPNIANAKKSFRLQEKAQELVNEKEFQDSIRSEGLKLAIEAVRSGKTSMHGAAMEYGVYRSTLIRHVKAATKQGNSTPNVTRGRHSYLSDEVISVEKQKARDNDDRLKSR